MKEKRHIGGMEGMEGKGTEERAVESRFCFRWSRYSVTSTVHLSSWGFLSNPLCLVSPQAFYGKCQCFRSHGRPLTEPLLYSDAFIQPFYYYFFSFFQLCFAITLLE